MIKSNQRQLNILHVVMDAIIMIVAYFAAWAIKFGEAFLNSSDHSMYGVYVVALIVIVPSFLILYSMFGLYTPKRMHGQKYEMFNIFKANTVGVVSWILILYMAHLEHFSREMIFIFLGINIFLELLARVGLRMFLRHIRKKGFNQKLSVYGREIVIQPLHKKTTDFWPVVWDIRKKFNDRVRFIKLDFRGEGENKSADGLMALITQLARKGDCAALLELSHKPGSPEINLQELHDDLTHIAAICLNEGIFDLTVHFAYFGCYRYGADIMAQFGIEEEAISSFGVELLSCFDGNSPTFALIQWMDKMNKILKDYANTGILQKGRKKGPRRKAC